MRIKIQSTDQNVLDKALVDILDVVKAFKIEIIGPICMPVKKMKFSGSQKVVMHKRLMDIVDPSKEVIECLQKLNIPIGVEILIK